MKPWKNTPFTARFNIEYPIIQAPMAGGATTEELVALVSNLGGLGSLGAGYMSADAIKLAVLEIRRLTNKPFAVNLFIPEDCHTGTQQMNTAVDAINGCIGSRLDIKISRVSAPYSPIFDQQIEILQMLEVPVFSFTFGLLDEYWVKKFKANKTFLIGTATSLEEALVLQDHGVDAVVAQGCEAGGHRASFLLAAEESLVPIDTLLHQLTAHLKIPVVASGGIMSGREIVRKLRLGASAVQMGTAFLTCDEAGVPLAYKKSLLDQTRDTTVLTRAFSGKLARGLKNHFTKCMDKKTNTILPYPIQNKLTKPMRDLAKKTENIEFMSLWAGQFAHLTRKCNVTELFEILISEAESVD